MSTIVTVEVKNSGTGPYLEVTAKQLQHQKIAIIGSTRDATSRAANHQLLVNEIRRAIRGTDSPFMQPDRTTTAE